MDTQSLDGLTVLTRQEMVDTDGGFLVPVPLVIGGIIVGFAVGYYMGQQVNKR